MHHWLRELVFQGVFGVERPARLSLDAGLCHLVLPAGLTPAGVHPILLATLFADEFPEQDLSAWIGDPAAVRLGATLLDPQQRPLTLYRRLTRDSVVLRANHEPQELARGAHQAAALLRERHHLPPLRDFLLLQCWDFSDFLKDAAPQAAASAGAPGEHAALIQRWRDTARHEELSQDLDAVTYDLKDAERRFEEVDKLVRREANLKAEIAAAEQRLQLDDDERALIEQFDDRVRGLERRKEQLQAQTEEAREARLRALPPPLYKNRRLLGGLVAAALFFVASALIARPLALANLAFLGLSTWALIRHMEAMEAASAFDVRAEQIYLHIEQAGRERAELDRVCARVLARVNLPDLGALRDKLQELGALREELQRRAQPDDKERQRLQKRHREEEVRLGDLRARAAALARARDALPTPDMPAYELESMLYQRGVDTSALHDAAAAPPPPARHRSGPARDPLDLFFAIQEAAARAGALPGGRLSEKGQELWRRFSVHLLGRRFEELTLDAAGRLHVRGMSAAELARWAAAQPEQLNALALALSAALLTEQPAGGGARFACVRLDALHPSIRARLDKITSYLGKYAQIVLLEAP